VVPAHLLDREGKPMTTSYYVEMNVAIDSSISRAEVEEHIDKVADAFEELPDVVADVGVDFAARRLDFCMTVSATDEQNALGLAVTAARTAVHAAGGGTAGWDGLLADVLDKRLYRSSVAPSTLDLDHC
jgi:hypothetical protein